MDWTDVHYRQLARLITKHTFLYTEMVVDSTLIHNPDTDRHALAPSLAISSKGQQAAGAGALVGAEA